MPVGQTNTGGGMMAKHIGKRDITFLAGFILIIVTLVLFIIITNRSGKGMTEQAAIDRVRYSYPLSEIKETRLEFDASKEDGSGVLLYSVVVDTPRSGEHTLLVFVSQDGTTAWADSVFSKDRYDELKSTVNKHRMRYMQ
jgi:hypothetical protein